MTHGTWKEQLGERISEGLGREIDIFETQMALRRQGKLEPKVFAETRLRKGVYGQRYDNGLRHDGAEQRTLAFPCGDLEKGPDTVWDAPGMVRVKIPMGRLTADQMDALAETAEEYSDAILHVTTRQDIQLHFVHIDDTPDLMRRLAAVGITTQEACGNAVRNVCACQFSGVCAGEAFDVTPYAQAATDFLMGHEDTQDFGRKFKIAFSGCAGEACGLANFHDIGVVARTAVVDGEVRRGFSFRVGGGLGAVPRQATVLDEFLPVEELLPMSQAICRIFGRYGEKANRSRARLKFLIKQLGFEEFERLVRAERERLPEDPRWTALLDQLHGTDDRPLKPGAPLAEGDHGAAFEAWRHTNTRAQKQPGYVAATVRLPLGDCTSQQMRALADLARATTGDTVRCTVEQNLVFRWVPEADLPAFHAALARIGVDQAGAGTLADITSCPGTDTCKLGISASRGLAGELEQRLAARSAQLDPGVRRLRVKVSGCFNSCGQHHVADIGFLGVSRAIGGRRVAHYQLVVGGEWTNNGGSFGLAMGAFPSKAVPAVVERLTELWVSGREEGERFQDYIRRVGKGKVRQALDELKAVPTYEEDPGFYTDWGDAREYTVGDIGVGECAGEVVSGAEFALAAAEREVFEAQLQLDEGRPARAAALAYRAMLTAARGLVRVWPVDVADAPDAVVSAFQARLLDTRLFHDRYAKGKFAAYLLKRHASPPGDDVDAETAHTHIEEANLFVEAAHACHDRLRALPQTPDGPRVEAPRSTKITKSLDLL